MQTEVTDESPHFLGWPASSLIKKCGFSLRYKRGKKFIYAEGANCPRNPCLYFQAFYLQNPRDFPAVVLPIVEPTGRGHVITKWKDF